MIMLASRPTRKRSRTATDRVAMRSGLPLGAGAPENLRALPLGVCELDSPVRESCGPRFAPSSSPSFCRLESARWPHTRKIGDYGIEAYDDMLGLAIEFLPAIVNSEAFKVQPTVAAG